MIKIATSKGNKKRAVVKAVISKRTRYRRLADKYFVPPINSKGVSDDYLKKVEEGTVFRVEVVELNKFLATLTRSQLSKAAYTCKWEAYLKVNCLLQELGQPTLGFRDGIVPDGEWLYRVARFVDPWNLCCLFEEAAPLHERPDIDSYQMVTAKRALKRLLFGESGLEDRPRVCEALSELELAHKKYKSRHAELDFLMIEGRHLEALVKTARQELEAKLTQTSLMVYSEGMGISIVDSLAKGDDKKKELWRM